MCAQRVVVGVDGSPPSFAALDAAAVESQQRAADLDVVYCVDDLDGAGAVLRAAASRVAGRHPGLVVVTTAVVGDPADVLVERGRDAALTVVGSRGTGAFAGLMTPSVSHRVAARTDAPLLVVRGRDAPRSSQRLSRGAVLLGLEDDDSADAALFAFEEAELRHTRLGILPAWTNWKARPESADRCHAARTEEGASPRTTALGALAGEVAPPAHAPCQRHPHLAVGIGSVRSTPCRALVAATGDADLVVVTVHRRRNRKGNQLTPAVAALLHRAHCPVAIVPVPGG